MTSASEREPARAIHDLRARSQSALGLLASGAAAPPPVVAGGTAAPQSKHAAAPRYTRPDAHALQLKMTVSSTATAGALAPGVATASRHAPGNASSQRGQPHTKP